jgi:hypothetical protein
LIDAPPPDAPPSCPLMGAPQFSRVLHQDVLQDCIDYTISASANRALALCSDDQGASFYVAEGEIDAPMQHAGGFETLTNHLGATLDPDGTVAYVYASYPAAATTGWLRFTRTADLQWTFDRIASELPVAPITTPTRGSPQHIMAVTGMTFLDMVANARGIFSTQDAYTAAELGASGAPYGPTWTSDGLQLLYYDRPMIAGQHPAIAYTRRASLADRFGPAVHLDSISVYAQNGASAFGVVGEMTDDCGRFYFSVLSSVFYVQQ